MGVGTGLRHPAASTDSVPVPEIHRPSAGLPWLIAVAVIPLLIAAIGYGAFDQPRPAHGAGGPVPAQGTSGTSTAPKLSLAFLSITRNGNDLTLVGDFPDDSAKGALLTAVKGSLPGVNVIDQIHINPNIDALDFAKAAPIFKDSASIPDFSLVAGGDTITLAGTAASPDQKNAVSQDAARTWSTLKVVDKLVVSGPVPPPALPAAGQCNDLQSAINAVTGGPIMFANDGFSLTPADYQILIQVSGRLKACPTAHATINGFSDNSGVEAINIALSSQRAQRVADFLAANGVAGAVLIVKGLGSVNPVAPNDTVDGRAKNRRVEVVVS